MFLRCFGAHLFPTGHHLWSRFAHGCHISSQYPYWKSSGQNPAKYNPCHSPLFSKVRGSLVILFCLRGCICFLFPQNCSRLFLVSLVDGETRVSRFERKSSEHATKSPTPRDAGDGEKPHVYLRIARRIRMTCAFLRNQTLRWQTWANRKKNYKNIDSYHKMVIL